MLKPDQKIALYMEASVGSEYGKMGYGVMRYISNPVVCVIDSTQAGKTVRDACALPFDIPIVANVSEAHALNADVLITGTAPSGGRIPEDWLPPLKQALTLGMSLVNGLHDPLNELLAAQSISPEQYIWDTRTPSFIPQIAAARAAKLNNLRVLMVGTDMAIGKMTAGLELYHWAKQQSINAAFIASGQIGITITGRGIPLDAFKVDHACGAVETAVLEAADHEVIFVEGQGSLLHPGSSATLSLMRGSCTNRLVLCHRAGQTHLRTPKRIALPPLREFIQLNEELASVCGSLVKAQTIGVALNTAHQTDKEAQAEILRLEDELGLPVEDTVRNGAAKLGRSLLSSQSKPE